MIIEITLNGIKVPEQELIDFIGKPYLNELFAKLIITNTKRMGNKYQTREDRLYLRSQTNLGNMLYFSRFSLKTLVEHIKQRTINLETKWTLVNKIHKGSKINNDMRPGVILDNNQQIASDAISAVYSKDALKKGQASCVFVMGTGLGKTYIGCSKIADIGLKTLIITPSEVVMKEWKTAIKLSYPNIIVGEYTGKRKIDGDVVLTIINSMCADEFCVKVNDIEIKYTYSEYFSKFGFVIYDEIHNYTSPARQKVLWRTNFMYGLGLTATPDENAWGLDIIFEKHVGPLLKASEIPDFDTKTIIWKGDIYPIHYCGPPEFTRILRNPGNGWTSHCDMVKQFCSDPYRNELITKIIKNLYESGRNTFVFFNLREYATDLSIMLRRYIPELNESGDESTTILMGGASEAQYESSKTAKIVLTTYGFGWQGLSIPRMDAILFATPRMAKMKQIIGRILRRGGDISISRIVYDIVDYNTDLGKNEYKERAKTLANKELYDFHLHKPDKWIVQDARLINVIGK